MDESIRKLAGEVLEAIEKGSPRALEWARSLAESLVDGPPTNPAIPIAEMRRRAMTTQTTVNQAEVFLGQLAVSPKYDDQVELVKGLIRVSFDRGEMSSRVEMEGLRTLLEEERARRIDLEAKALRSSKEDMDTGRALRMAVLRFSRGEISLKELVELDMNKETIHGS